MKNENNPPVFGGDLNFLLIGQFRASVFARSQTSPMTSALKSCRSGSHATGSDNVACALWPLASNVGVCS